MTEEIHVDDVGTEFSLTILDDGSAVDLSSATTKEIVFVKPDRTPVTKPASFVTNGSDGKLKYVSVGGDLDQPGYWKIQAHVALPTGEWHSSVETFEVFANL